MWNGNSGCSLSVTNCGWGLLIFILATAVLFIYHKLSVMSLSDAGKLLDFVFRATTTIAIWSTYQAPKQTLCFFVEWNPVVWKALTNFWGFAVLWSTRLLAHVDGMKSIANPERSECGHERKTCCMAMLLFGPSCASQGKKAQLTVIQLFMVDVPDDFANLSGGCCCFSYRNVWALAFTSAGNFIFEGLSFVALIPELLRAISQVAATSKRCRNWRWIIFTQKPPEHFRDCPIMIGWKCTKLQQCWTWRTFWRSAVLKKASDIVFTRGTVCCKFWRCCSDLWYRRQESLVLTPSALCLPSLGWFPLSEPTVITVDCCNTLCDGKMSSLSARWGKFYGEQRGSICFSQSVVRSYLSCFDPGSRLSWSMPAYPLTCVSFRLYYYIKQLHFKRFIFRIETNSEKNAVKQGASQCPVATYSAVKHYRDCGCPVCLASTEEMAGRFPVVGSCGHAICGKSRTATVSITTRLPLTRCKHRL